MHRREQHKGSIRASETIAPRISHFSALVVRCVSIQTAGGEGGGGEQDREDQESTSQDMFQFTFSSANGGRRDRR